MDNKILLLQKKRKITMLACYDFSFASLFDAAGIDVLLVGDSMANVVLGMDDTRDISVTEILNHTRAVAKGAKNAMVVTDAPYAAYQKNPKKALYYCEKFMDAGADGVKIEWCNVCVKVVKELIKNNIPVMGHIGLTPQTAKLLGGFKVQGRDSAAAARLLHQAKLFEDLGAFSLVVECVPHSLAGKITNNISIPTIGIGAGNLCRGQVLVSYDMLGIYDRVQPKFVRRYAQLGAQVIAAAKGYIKDVRAGRYPSKDESYF